MKKKQTPVLVPDDDPLEGGKAFGCLFIGIWILVVIAVVLDMIIDNIRL